MYIVYFECDLYTSREKIIRYRTVLGTPRLRANAGRFNISLGELAHPDRGWNACAAGRASARSRAPDVIRARSLVRATRTYLVWPRKISCAKTHRYIRVRVSYIYDWSIIADCSGRAPRTGTARGPDDLLWPLRCRRLRACGVCGSDGTHRKPRASDVRRRIVAVSLLEVQLTIKYLGCHESETPAKARVGRGAQCQTSEPSKRARSERAAKTLYASA